MELAFTACNFCQKNTFKYTCPKCNALYCSQRCFRKPKHKKCTSSFYNVFNQSSAFGRDDRNDVIMRYVALRNMIEMYNKKPEKAESESGSVESKSIWTNDDCVSSRLVANDSDSDDDHYPYFDYAYDSNDDGDSYDESDELNDEDDDSSSSDSDVSDDSDNNNSDDANDNSNHEGAGGNHVSEDSISDDASGIDTEDSEDSDVSDSEDSDVSDSEYDLSWEVD
ncbi:dentin sialophosphoprotein [Zeugodacus cucurbitae]|nr:dentin sialophosphoprotein [Zeugodacus cucurbitae]